MGHARALLALTQRRQQVEVGTLVAKRGLSVRDTEGMVRGILARASGSSTSKDAKPIDPNVPASAGRTREKLGAPGGDPALGLGQGKVVVNYHSLDELDGILAHIK